MISSLSTAQQRQFLLITAVALAVFAGLRMLPIGTNLSHMDFRVDPKAGNAIEFCDPLNPQFIPVVAARSPVVMSVVTAEPAVAGREVGAVVKLRTGSGKPVAPEDLLVTHTRPLHLLVVDPTLGDYQHLHPRPSGTPGEWSFAFTPRAGGTYRIFADFTPAATGRGLYASVDLEVSGPGHSGALVARGSDGYRFALTPGREPVRAGELIDLQFSMQRVDGGPVPLEPVMGAYAHLVAFDEARSGFAHLHPVESETLAPADRSAPSLKFKLTIPRAGRYIVWAQVNLGGVEGFLPFTLSVLE